jgi:hypothetical protein
MLLACRLAGLSALEAHYAGRVALTQSGPCWSAEACSDSAPAHWSILSKPWSACPVRSIFLARGNRRASPRRHISVSGHRRHHNDHRRDPTTGLVLTFEPLLACCSPPSPRSRRLRWASFSIRRDSRDLGSGAPAHVRARKFGFPGSRVISSSS